jgi:hypothetical protein
MYKNRQQNMEQPYVNEFGTKRLLRAFLINGGKAVVFKHVIRHFNGGCGMDCMSKDDKGNLYVAQVGAGGETCSSPSRKISLTRTLPRLEY